MKFLELPTQNKNTVPKAIRVPKIITPNFCKLKRWFSDDSNKMVVEICRKIPITTAIIF